MRMAAAILSVILCGWCAAQESRATLDSDLLTQPGFHVLRARASADAYRLYDSVNRARAAIKAGDRQTANDQVHWAVAAADRLHASGAGDSVPIYMELAENFSKAVPPPSDSHALRFGAVDQPVDRRTAMLEYTTMSLNLPQAQPQLEAARAALEDGEMKTADGALAAAQNAVTFQSVAANMPLLRARQNLDLAAGQVRGGAFDVAQTTLRTAARQLQEYATNGGARADDARQLAREISSCADTIQTQRQAAGARIERYWDSAAALSGPAS